MNAQTSIYSASKSIASSCSTLSLQEITAMVDDDLAKVDKLLINNDLDTALIPAISDHIINAGGKRIRPLILILICKMFGYNGSRHHQLAAVIELIHTATLLHDDVIDNSSNRRGLSTANTLWNNKASVLVGDYMFAKAFQLMVADGDLNILPLLSETSAIIVSGEVLQLEYSHDVTISEANYYRIIDAKTAALFRTAAHVGAIIADQPTNQALAMSQFGEAFGRAFQMIDDLIDYVQTDSGKNIGDDFYEGKVTLPIMQLMATCSHDTKAKLETIYNQQEFTATNLTWLIKALEEYQIPQQCRKLSETYLDKAYQLLEACPKNDYQLALTSLIAIVGNRRG